MTFLPSGRTARTMLALAALFTCVTAQSASLEIFVSPAGDDQQSGSSPEISRSSTNGPLRTVAGALAKWRALRGTDQARHGVRILLAGGVYPLDSPLTLSPGESGLSATAPVTIEAQPGAKPVLSGGRRITGWKPARIDAGAWEADVPEVREGRWRFRTLFVNGQRRQRARTPNDGYFRIQGSSPQDSPVRLKFKPGDIKPEWAGSDAEVVGFLAWADFRMHIDRIDAAESVAVLSNNPRPSNKEANAKYFIENTPDGCDAPGEWYLDRHTGRVIYRPMPGEDISRADVVAGALDDLVLMRGDPATQEAVRHVIFRGLTFANTGWTMPTNGFADTQAAVGTRGDFRAEYATDCVIEDCTFRQLSGYAIELGAGCQRFRIVGNEVSDIGGGGIRIGETSRRTGSFEENHSHLFTDNHLHQLGRIYAPAVGVFILQSGTNRIAHNHIHDLYYTAVSVGWNWGYRETPCRENVIEFNHMHDIGQSLLSDMGAVYTLGPQRGTVIRNNRIHDVNAFTYGGWGLYPDEGSSDIVWENNIVYRCKSAGFHQHYGRDNVVRNNIFAFNREHQLMRTREEEHNSFFFTNNIVYFDSGDLLGSNWKNDRFVIDRNIYWDTRLAAQPGSLRFSKATLDQWRQRGHDAHSQMIDPRFKAPDQFDFQLQPDSPALRMGFQPIDSSRIGVRPKAARH